MYWRAFDNQLHKKYLLSTKKWDVKNPEIICESIDVGIYYCIMQCKKGLLKKVDRTIPSRYMDNSKVCTYVQTSLLTSNLSIHLLSQLDETLN